jgi:hypothetical protein
VDGTVAKPQIQLTRMCFATIWKYCEEQWFRKTTAEVVWVGTTLLSHEINNAESIDGFCHQISFSFILNFSRLPLIKKTC